MAGEVQREVAHCTAILVSVTVAARQEYWAARVLRSLSVSLRSARVHQQRGIGRDTATLPHPALHPCQDGSTYSLTSRDSQAVQLLQLPEKTETLCYPRIVATFGRCGAIPSFTADTTGVEATTHLLLMT